MFLLVTFLWACSTTSKQTLSFIPNSSETVAEYQGPENMGWAITHYITYPESEKDSNRAGTVEVSFTVNEMGKVENVKASIRNSNEPSDLAVARKQIQGKEVMELNVPVLQSVISSVEMLQFKPAERDGKPVSSEFSTSVEFILIP